MSAAGLLPRAWSFKPTAGTISHDFALALTFSEEITVGSRVVGVGAEKAVPIDILTSKQIEATGASEVMQVLQRLAPSFNFPRTTIADGSAAVRPATLRGLGPDQVLVLVNGKRRHATALVHVNGTVGRGSTGVDLNAIPVSAIERIEILRDGAAAQYGSDAIAGVINIVLKSGVAQARVDIKAGTTATNQGVGADTTWDGGLFDGGLNKGFKLGKGWVFLTGEYRNRDRTNRAGPDPRDQVQAGDAGNNPVAQPNHWVGDPEARDYLTFLNAQIPVGASESTFVYAFGGWSYRDATAPGFYRRALQVTQTWPQIYPVGFLPLIQTPVTDGAGTFGVRGTKSRWYWDASLQYGRNGMDFNIQNTLNASLGPNIPPNKTEFYAGTYTADQFLANLDFSRPLAVGLAGPLNVAFGAEFRREGYKMELGSRGPVRGRGRARPERRPRPGGGTGLPGAASLERDRRLAHQRGRLCRPRGRRREPRADRRRRPLRALQRLREQRRREAHGPPPGARAFRDPRGGQHGLPRPVARPVPLLRGQHELPSTSPASRRFPDKGSRPGRSISRRVPCPSVQGAARILRHGRGSSKRSV